MNRSETRLAISAVGALALLLLSGCAQEKKVEPVPVGDMEEYRDPGIGFAIKHPKGWISNSQVGRARFYNAQDVDKKFLDPPGVGAHGVEISVEVINTPEPAAKITQLKSEMSSIGIVLGQEQTVTVAGTQATKVPYTANYGGSNIIYGHHVHIPGDSVIYDLGFAGFGDYYNAYATVFDASLSSFELPKPKEPGRDETLPSETMTEYSGKMFSFLYPDNFNFTNAPKGKFEEVIELRGGRQDCSIRFDVFDAKGLTVEKVYEQNKGTYRAKSTGKATVGGENALFVNYSSRADVESRAYFVVKSDKVVRFTLNWYKPQANKYLPVYEKAVSSIKFK